VRIEDFGRTAAGFHKGSQPKYLVERRRLEILERLPVLPIHHDNSVRPGRVVRPQSARLMIVEVDAEPPDHGRKIGRRSTVVFFIEPRAADLESGSLPEPGA